MSEESVMQIHLLKTLIKIIVLLLTIIEKTDTDRYPQEQNPRIWILNYDYVSGKLASNNNPPAYLVVPVPPHLQRHILTDLLTVRKSSGCL